MSHSCQEFLVYLSLDQNPNPDQILLVATFVSQLSVTGRRRLCGWCHSLSPVPRSGLCDACDPSVCMFSLGT